MKSVMVLTCLLLLGSVVSRADADDAQSKEEVKARLDAFNVGSTGYYIFTDRGDARIERAALGVGGRRLEACGVYDIVDGGYDLKAFVSERDPKTIGLNMSETIGAADGLSHTGFEELVRTLGPDYASRFVSAEKLVSDFRSRRVASEIVAFGEAGEMSREIAERAFSNEIITPGPTGSRQRRTNASSSAATC